MNLFETDCIIGDRPTRVKLHVVPVETITIATIFGRDYILSPQCGDISSVIPDVKSEVKSSLNENTLNEESNNILQLSCLSEPVSTVDQLNINSQLEHCIVEKVKSLFLNEYLNNLSADTQIPSPQVQLVISLKHDQPISYRPCRFSYMDKQKLQKILDRLVKDKIIRSSESPYASPIVLVHKKNGEFCVDYRELNKITIKNNFPTPLIEDHLDRLRNKRYFTTLDLRDGFHHVKVAESSVKLTAFNTPLGQFEYLRMPFGLTNAPKVFQRFINSIFSDLIRQDKILLFVDDILIATESIDEHLDILKEILRRASQF